MDPIFPAAPEDLAALSDEQLAELVAAFEEAADRVAADPDSFVGDDRSYAELVSEMEAGVEALEQARVELAGRVPVEAPVETPDAEALAAQVAELASRARPEAPEPEPDEGEG